MKKTVRTYKRISFITAMAAVVLAAVLVCTGVFAEGDVTLDTNADYSIQDPSPVIYVAEKNADSVVGVITMEEDWDEGTREVSQDIVSEGSGVVIAEGGYILTNYHVIEDGDAYQILMPSGEKVDAELVGSDSSYDLAVLRVEEGADALKPVTIGSVSSMSVGSTVVAIGNPSGETLSNTVTAGYISCLERSVNGGNTTRTVNYIQHCAAINAGNSGGGLFDVNGNLIGINTLKYSGSVYSSASYEGLGFAIPVDIALDIVPDLIQFGKVQRAALGVTVRAVTGADEATDTQTPAGLYVNGLTEGGPAEQAGVLEGDIITAINDTRITTIQELTDVLDSFSEGDTVQLTIARYTYENSGSGKSADGYTRTALGTGSGNGYGGYGGFGGRSGSDDFYDFFDDFFGDYYDYYYGGGSNDNAQQRGRATLEILTLDVTLAILN